MPWSPAQVHSSSAACVAAIHRAADPMVSVAAWQKSQTAASGPSARRIRIMDVGADLVGADLQSAQPLMYVNWGTARHPRGAIPQEYVERHRRAIRHSEIRRDAVSRHIR